MLLILILTLVKSNNKMGTYNAFQRYIDFDYLTFDAVTLAVNYICSNLNAPSFIFPYWYDMYCYTSKTFMVIALRKSRGEEQKAKLGEGVCTGGQIVNFLHDKDHRTCHCSHVFYKAVF